MEEEGCPVCKRVWEAAHEENRCFNQEGGFTLKARMTDVNIMKLWTHERLFWVHSL